MTTQSWKISEKFTGMCNKWEKNIWRHYLTRDSETAGSDSQSETHHGCGSVPRNPHPQEKARLQSETCNKITIILYNMLKRYGHKKFVLLSSSKNKMSICTCMPQWSNFDTRQTIIPRCCAYTRSNVTRFSSIRDMVRTMFFFKSKVNIHVSLT